jgi:transcriptional regulator with XRE-family HTH domain
MQASKQIGRNISEARRRALLNQGQLGAKIGVKQRAISKLETGETELRALQLLAIAEACDVSPFALLKDVHAADARAELLAGNSSEAPPSIEAPVEPPPTTKPARSRKATGKAPPRAPRKKKAAVQSVG